MAVASPPQPKSRGARKVTQPAEMEKWKSLIRDQTSDFVLVSSTNKTPPPKKKKKKKKKKQLLSETHNSSEFVLGVRFLLPCSLSKKKVRLLIELCYSVFFFFFLSSNWSFHPKSMANWMIPFTPDGNVQIIHSLDGSLPNNGGYQLSIKTDITTSNCQPFSMVLV